MLTVEDSGPGFAPTSISRAFEPFGRASRNSPAHYARERPAHASTGIGLAIVQAIAEAHGGSAHAENLPAGGARVTMTIQAG